MMRAGDIFVSLGKDPNEFSAD